MSARRLRRVLPRGEMPAIHGKDFLRFCYAGSADEMRESVTRIGSWLRR